MTTFVALQAQVGRRAETPRVSVLRANCCRKRLLRSCSLAASFEVFVTVPNTVSAERLGAIAALAFVNVSLLVGYGCGPVRLTRRRGEHGQDVFGGAAHPFDFCLCFDYRVGVHVLDRRQTLHRKISLKEVSAACQECPDHWYTQT
jgi:hypothetical protein